MISIKNASASLGDILSGKEGGSFGSILEYDGALLQRLGLHQEQPHHRLLLENNHTVHTHRMQRLRREYFNRCKFQHLGKTI
jgi:hypothetical protein